MNPDPTTHRTVFHAHGLRVEMVATPTAQSYDEPVMLNAECGYICGTPVCFCELRKNSDSDFDFSAQCTAALISHQLVTGFNDGAIEVALKFIAEARHLYRAGRHDHAARKLEAAKCAAGLKQESEVR